MILRIWRGWTRPSEADAYESLLRRDVFGSIEARTIGGYLGIQLVRRDRGDETEIVTLMRYSDVDAVRSFAGDDYEAAVVPPEARALLSRFEERSAHYEIIEER